MDLSDTQITEKQLTELCTQYENKNKITKNLIRDSLDVRRNVKAKINEDKERANSLLQVLERLDEYEKAVIVQLEAAEKMEDPESLKTLEIIKKYESMVREQREVWAKYEEEYEQLPMAQKRRKAQLEVLKTSIQVKLVNYKIEEKKKMIKLKNQISKRKEQLEIINFAKFMVAYKTREKNYYEFQSKVNALKQKKEDLHLQIQHLEQLNVNHDNKVNAVNKKPSMIQSSLPSMDFSMFPASQKNNNYILNNPDVASVYSFSLEEEYVLSEADDIGKNLFKSSVEPSKMEESNGQNNVESQETNVDTLMDINSEEMLSDLNEENIENVRSNKKRESYIHKNDENSKINNQESLKKSSREAAKKRANQNENQVSDGYSNCDNIQDEKRNRRVLTERRVPSPAKIPKHVTIREDYLHSESTHGDQRNMCTTTGRAPCSPKVTAKINEWQQKSSPKQDCGQSKLNRDLLIHQHQQQQLQQQYYQQQSQPQYQQKPLHQQQRHNQQQQPQLEQQHQLHQQQQRPQQQQQKELEQQYQLYQQQQSQQQQHQRQKQHQLLQQQQLNQQPPQRKPLQQQQNSQQQQRSQQKQRPQQQHPQQQQVQTSWSPKLNKNKDGQNFKRDLTGFSQSNKPLIKSNECVNYDTQRIFQKQQVQHQTAKQHPVEPMNVEFYDSETLDVPPQMMPQPQFAASVSTPSMTLQSEPIETPQYRNISADSMMNMCATDSNTSADNISAIIGSDITEPGGVMGLINHIHGDADDISEELDFENMNKFCSPLQQGSSTVQQQPIRNGNGPIQFNETAANHDSQDPTKKSFALLQFGQTNQTNQANLSQPFFR